MIDKRMMYAQGQRVAKTMDGSRPGYRGDGGYQGGATNQGGAGNPGSGNGGDGDARENYRSKQYTNLPTPTVTVGVDKFDNPIEIKTTYTDKRNRQNLLDALNKKGISSFDPRVTKTGINFFDPNNLINSFAPKQQNKFGIMDLIMIAASGGLLGPKIATGAKMFNTGKKVLDFANTIGLTDKNVLDSFTSNFTENFGKGTSKGTTSTNNTTTNNGGNGGGEGITSIDNQAAGYDEYILLLQKLQSGNISDSERNRFNVLKNMLGI